MALTPFRDRLPLPEVVQPVSQGKRESYYEVDMRQVEQQLHADLPFPARVWGYNGSYPGPTFDVEQGHKVKVKWINNLPQEHLFNVIESLHGACNVPEVRTVVHLHGGHTEEDSDGYPEAWFTQGFEKVGPYFRKEVYEYKNCQRGTTLWYHDHTLGITRLNVYAGLAGFYLLRDKLEPYLNLPKGDYEIPIVIQDRNIDEVTGQLVYPDNFVPEFFGDYILANGKVWPFLEVEPRKYRFRLLNGSNTRQYELRLSSNDQIHVIGTDGGFLRSPKEVNTLTIGPGERYDVIVDFSGNDVGDEIILENIGPNTTEGTTDRVMQFKVVALTDEDTSQIPPLLSDFVPLREECQTTNFDRNLTLDVVIDELEREMHLLDMKEWIDRISEIPKHGSVEVWNLINTTVDTHPIHLHLVQFQLLDRRGFTSVNGDEVVYDGTVFAPEPYEQGWKDTILAPPGQVTRIIVPFNTQFTGQYVWHCHILEHEDHEMMRPYIVMEKKCNCKKCRKHRKKHRCDCASICSSNTCRDCSAYSCKCTQCNKGIYPNNYCPRKA